MENVVKGLPKELIDKLNSFHMEFKDLDLIDIYSKNFKSKFYDLTLAFNKAIDINNENLFIATGINEISDDEFNKIILNSKLKDCCQVGKTCQLNSESEFLIKRTSDLIDKLLHKIHNN